MKRSVAFLTMAVFAASLAMPVAAGAQDAETIKIAYIGPLTGNYETYGRHQRQAIELAVDDINANGGINGATVEVEWNDDKSDPNETANMAYKVCDEKDVLTVFGPFTTTSALATVDIFKDAQIPVCSGSVSPPQPVKRNSRAIPAQSAQRNPETEQINECVFFMQRPLVILFGRAQSPSSHNISLL